jgi:uncharacterized membrane protein YczE
MLRMSVRVPRTSLRQFVVLIGLIALGLGVCMAVFKGWGLEEWMNLLIVVCLLMPALFVFDLWPLSQPRSARKTQTVMAVLIFWLIGMMVGLAYAAYVGMTYISG